ncbi:hypothetical protein MKW92_027545 [Papaver armeniacum]|nr:hypothetical protein MKW92_027545 [Papaver armeniacum]
MIDTWIILIKCTSNCSVHEQGSNSTIHSRFDDEMRERRKSANGTANVKMAAEKASDNHNKEKTLQPATQVECTEVPFYMFDRGSDKQGTSTSPLFDLSNFETPITKSGMDAAQKTAPVALEKATSSHPSNRPRDGRTEPCRNFYVENQDKVPVLADPTEEMLALVDIPSGNCNSKNQDEVQVYADATEESEGLVLELDGLEMREQYHVVDVKPGKNGENNVPPVDIPALEVHDSAHDFEMPERKDNAENEDKIPLAADELSGYCKLQCHQTTPSTPAVGFCESERENLKISNAASFKEPILVDELKQVSPILVDELNAVGKFPDVVLLGDHLPQESSRRVTRFSSSLPPGSSKNPVAMEVKDHQTGRHTIFVKAEPEEFEYEACTAVKTENIDYNSPELAVDLPWFAVRGRKPSAKRIVVFRDSAMRKWPVVYQERFSFRVLASGWKALAEANNLQKGDICLMSVENASKGLLQLEIKRK